MVGTDGWYGKNWKIKDYTYGVLERTWLGLNQ